MLQIHPLALIPTGWLKQFALHGSPYTHGPSLGFQCLQHGRVHSSGVGILAPVFRFGFGGHGCISAVHTPIGLQHNGGSSFIVHDLKPVGQPSLQDCCVPFLRRIVSLQQSGDLPSIVTAFGFREGHCVPGPLCTNCSRR